MTHPDHSGRPPRRRRAARPDSTRPTPARPGGRRGGDRRPWPTAATTTRVSPGKPGTGTRSQGSSSPSKAKPTPATVWTAGSTPIDLHATWPAALVERVVTSFSEPAARVVLLGWPTPKHPRPRLAAAGLDGSVDGVVDGVVDRPDSESDPGLAAAAATVERLGRAVRIEHLLVGPASSGPASPPFWADLIDGSRPAPAAVPATPKTAPDTHPSAVTGPAGGVDLIVTSRPSQDHGDGGAADLVALQAARLLRVGGILVVLTHCDWTTGVLADPTGAVVAAGQNADLLYLQHIVALHVPIRDGHFHLTDIHPHDAPDAAGGLADRGSDEGGTGDVEVRARHRALVRGLPAPHRRIHSDALVFAQPHDHQPTLRPAAGAAVQGGDLR